MTEVESFLLKDIEKHGGSQSSWDWEADARFAKRFVADAVEDVMALLKSESPFPIQISGHRVLIYRKVTVKRLRGLRGLVKKGLVASHWYGLGAGGVNTFGVGRTRGYILCRLQKGRRFEPSLGARRK